MEDERDTLVTLGTQLQGNYVKLQAEKSAADEKCEVLQARVDSLEAENALLTEALERMARNYEELMVCKHPPTSSVFSFRYLIRFRNETKR